MSKVEVVQKQGLINDEGKVIVPLEYDSVEILTCGIYVAKVGTLNIKENKSVRNQHYHYKKLISVKDESKYHFYTDKGMITFNEPILDFMCTDDNEQKIIAIEVPEGWRLVEFDYEKNIFNKYYSIVNEILDICDEYIAVKTLNDGCKVYSLNNWEKVLDLIEADEITIIERVGFLVHEKETNKVGLYNLSGNMILDYEWDCIDFYMDYIRVKEYHTTLDAVKREGRYSYNGVEIQMKKYKC